MVWIAIAPTLAICRVDPLGEPSAYEDPMKIGFPIARARTETNTVGGITFEDPYQWLESSDEETLQWQTAQGGLVRAGLIGHVGPSAGSSRKTIETGPSRTSSPSTSVARPLIRSPRR